MSSVTAEVLLYFGTDDPEFRKSVEELRFSVEPEREAREIIDLVRPFYRYGYDEGYSDGQLNF